MTRILVVEDSPTQSEQLRLVLEAEGYSVDTASDGAQALERLGRFQFDAVVSDVLMPRMTGYELCRAIKSDTSLRETPVVLLTTLSGPMDIIQGLECGADNFVTKPYDAGHLVDRVNRILENRRLRGEGSLRGGIEILFLGRKLTISSGREQILSLLVSTFEDMVQTNRELREREAELAVAKARVEEYAGKLEVKVRISEEKYRGLMENARDAIFIVDQRGRVLELNREAELLLARPGRDIIGQPYEAFAVPAEQEYVAVQFDQMLTAGGLRTDNVRLQRPDGTQVCVDLSASVVETNEDRVALLIARDVTERNQLQQQAFQQDKLATMGTLAAGIAHEVNNPAAVVLGNLQLLRRDVDSGREVLAMMRTAVGQAVDGVPQDVDTNLAHFEPEDWAAAMDEMIGDCIHAAERISKIVGDLRRFAHPGEEAVVPVNVNEVLDTSLRMALIRISKQAIIETSYREDLPETHGIPGRLEQVFVNLLINAAQALEAGTTGENRICVATSVESGRLRIDITDTGPGISEEALPLIFESFFTTKARGEGTGLGLAICQEIVTNHGGEIEVSSKVGQGTSFTVYLPTSPP